MIQKAIEEVPSERESLLRAFEGSIRRLVKDPYGKFIIEKAIEVEKLPGFIVDELEREMEEVVTTDEFCHVWCQGLMLNLHLQAEAMKRLLPAFARCIETKLPASLRCIETNGTMVKNIMHCLASILGKDLNAHSDAKRGVYLAVKKHAFQIAKHKQGSKAIQNALENWTVDSEEILEGLLFAATDEGEDPVKKVIELTQDEYGFFVIRAIVRWHECPAVLCHPQRSTMRFVAKHIVDNEGQFSKGSGQRGRSLTTKRVEDIEALVSKARAVCDA